LEETCVNPEQPISVVLTSDSDFSKQLAVMIAGISVTAEREHRIFVLHDGYESALIDQINGIAGDLVTVHWKDARSGNLDSVQLATYPTAILFRLRIADLLPDSVDRVIYLDSDIAVRKPLGELWETELGEYPVGAVRDAKVPWAGAPAGPNLPE